MKDRYSLLQKGLFPETLPPCFVSVGIKKALKGLVGDLKSKAHFNRPTDYVRYNGTKHDGSRRSFGTPNPVSYFYVSDFIAKNWAVFEDRFASSPFTVSRPRVAAPEDDRPIFIPSLSELTTSASKKLAQSGFIMRTDIAQYFSSIYTHTVSWSAHGVEKAKRDQRSDSKENYFNRLDMDIRNCQRAESKGLIVGPDAFRIIAEFIACGLDKEIANQGLTIVGAARHVDDYMVGVATESEALVALANIRTVLESYHLNVNDNKTKTMIGTEPLNDLWAQDLRAKARRICAVASSYEISDLILLIDKSIDLARTLKTDSPIKIILRTMDELQIYNSNKWSDAEPYIQRIVSHHAHCIDYAALLVAKRFARHGDVDTTGWETLSSVLIKRNLILDNHHEVVWLLWLLLTLKINISASLISELSASNNDHIRALVIAAYTNGLIPAKPKISLGSKLETTNQNWLVNLVARSCDYSKADFTGLLSAEFSHLADKRLKLIDLNSFIRAAKRTKSGAISRTRYGYDKIEELDEADLDDEYDDDMEAAFQRAIARDD